MTGDNFKLLLLPKRIIVKILSFLDATSICKCSETSKQLQSIISECQEKLWHQQYCKYFYCDKNTVAKDLPLYADSWRALFMFRFLVER